MIRAKMRCIAKKFMENEVVEVHLAPVYGDTAENKTWSKWTPSGAVNLQITNPEAHAQFTVGAEYLVDFTLVEK